MTLVSDLLFVGQNVGIFAIACIFIGRTIRYLVKNFMDKDLEKFKTNLEQERIRFSKLHEDRANAIKELIGKIYDFDQHMHTITSPVEYKSIEQDFEKAKEVANDFLSFYKKNRIYFDEKICEKIDTINEKGKDAWYARLISRETTDIDKWKESWKKVDEIPGLIKELEEQFREILGVK